MTLPLTEEEKEESRKVQILAPIFLDRPALALSSKENTAYVEEVKRLREYYALP